MEKDDSFWLNVFYIVFAGIVAFIAWQAIYAVGIQSGWAERYDQYYTPMNHSLAVVLGLAGAWALRRDPERNDFLLACIGELRRITWPTGQETRRMTTIVCVVVVIFAFIMMIFDASWSYVLRQLMTAVGAISS